MKLQNKAFSLKNRPVGLTVFENKIYAVLQGEYDNLIAVVDLTSNEVIKQIRTPGEERLTPVIAAGNLLYVGAYASEYYNDFLASITPETTVLDFEKSTLTGSFAQLTDINSADNKILLAAQDKENRIIVTDPKTKRPSLIPVAGMPIAMTILGDKLYIALEDTDTVLVYDFYYGA